MISDGFRLDGCGGWCFCTSRVSLVFFFLVFRFFLFHSDKRCGTAICKINIYKQCSRRRVPKTRSTVVVAVIRNDLFSFPYDIYTVRYVRRVHYIIITIYILYTSSSVSSHSQDDDEPPPGDGDKTPCRPFARPLLYYRRLYKGTAMVYIVGYLGCCSIL